MLKRMMQNMDTNVSEDMVERLDIVEVLRGLVVGGERGEWRGRAREGGWAGSPISSARDAGDAEDVGRASGFGVNGLTST